MFLLFLILFSSLTSQANQEECWSLLGSGHSDDTLKSGVNKNLGEVKMIPSGRDFESFEIYKKVQHELIRDGGIAHTLGYARPPHQMIFATPEQLASLAIGGKHAMPHRVDGEAILYGLPSVGGVLEFVTGCQHCRSYYRDTTSRPEQIQVMEHVIGHNDVATHSMFSTSRNSEPMGASYELSTLMSNLYESEDRNEVALFYEQLLSMEYMQDLVKGSYDPSEDFITKSPKSGQKQVRHPEKPTFSALQALVANPPSGWPRWKLEMVKLFEKSNRILGFYTQQKILNEGWATFSQFLLPAYSKTHNSSEDVINFSRLMSGVAWRSLKNPYWLGVEGWMNIRKNFLQTAEIKKLSVLEQDQKFIEHAHEIMSWASDYDFIQLAFDESWIVEKQLFLYRSATGEEYDSSIKVKQDEEQKIAITRNAGRVIRYLANKFGNTYRRYPRVALTNFNFEGRGTTHYHHEVYENIPLTRKSIATTLYAHTQVWQRSFSLETIASTTWLKDKSQASPGFFKIRVEVDPRGRVTVFEETKTVVEEKGKVEEVSEKIHLELTTQLQKHIDHYRFELENGESEKTLDARDELFAPMISRIVEANIAHKVKSVNHSPTARKAVNEYIRQVKMRLARKLKEAVQGKIRVKRLPGRIRLRLFPEIPKFKFDEKVAQILEKERKENKPIPVEASLGSFAETVGTDKDLDIGPGKPGKGKRFPGPKPEEEGQGDGEGEEDGDPQDGEEQQPGGKDPSEGNQGEIDIPLEEWGELLKEELKLKNIRRTKGGNEITESIRMGNERRPSGDIIWDRTALAALDYAKLLRKKKGLPTKGISTIKLFKEGIPYITPADYIVRSRDTIKLPEHKAVLVAVLDMSGSMQGLAQKLEKELFWNVQALLKASYKEVVIRYVGFSDEAKEFPESEVFVKTTGGGTKYSAGFQLAEKILKEYSPDEYNFYVIGTGDAETTDIAQTKESLERLYQISQYVGFGHIKTRDGANMWSDGFVKMVEDLAQSNEWFGFSTVTSDRTTIFDALREFFGDKKR